MASTRRGRATKEAFEEAGRRVIAERGFLRTTVADIAREAGRSPASFYNYFESKEALLAELADSFLAEVTNRARPAYTHGTPVEVIIRAGVDAYVSTYRERMAEMLGVYQQSMIDEQFRQRWEAIRRTGEATLVQTIRRAQRAGYCPGVDARMTASALGLMMEQCCHVWLAGRGDGERRDLVPRADDGDVVDTLASIWYRAIFWRPESAPAAG